MSNSSRFWVGDFQRSERGMNEFNFLPWSGDYRGDLDGNGHMTVQWLGMTVHDAEQDGSGPWPISRVVPTWPRSAASGSLQRCDPVRLHP